MCTSLAQRSLVLCAELVLCWQVVRHNAGSRRLAEESAVLAEFPAWLKMLETTSLTKSYKMVVLRVLLDAGCLFSGMSLTDLARACRRFLQQHAVLCRDLQGEGHALDHAAADDSTWEAWWNKWPVDRWLSPQAGQTWFECRNQQIRFALPCAEALQSTLEALTGELVDWRLAQYASSRRLDVSTSGEFSFEAKVSHANGKPILFLPDKVKTPDRPVGPTVVQLPDGTEWTFKLVKIACNVAAPRGQKSNQLPDLLRQWFGPHAGLPGTAFQVRFQRQGDSWTIEPLTGAGVLEAAAESSTKPGPASSPELESEPEEKPVPPLRLQTEISVAARYSTHVPVYDVTAAAGGWGPEGSPTELGWIEIPDRRLVPGMFVARVVGRSMEPRIPSGSWCLFRACPAGTRQGRLLLVQCQTKDDPEDGGRYTVKRYASQRRVDEEGNQHTQIALQPLNPAYPTIYLDADTAVDLRIIGEYLTLILTPLSPYPHSPFPIPHYPITPLPHYPIIHYPLSIIHYPLSIIHYPFSPPPFPPPPHSAPTGATCCSHGCQPMVPCPLRPPSPDGATRAFFSESRVLTLNMVILQATNVLLTDADKSLEIGLFFKAWLSERATVITVHPSGAKFLVSPTWYR